MARYINENLILETFTAAIQDGLKKNGSISFEMTEDDDTISLNITIWKKPPPAHITTNFDQIEVIRGVRHD